MKALLYIFLLLPGLSLVNSAFAHQEEEIDLSAVPTRVIEAAKSSKPGIRFTEAEKITDQETIFYELEGLVGGQGYEIMISADGQVLEVELEDD